MPRFSAAVGSFLSSLLQELEKPKSLGFSDAELQERFEGAVTALPQCPLRDDLLRLCASCVAHLNKHLEGRFSSISVPRGMQWNLFENGGVQRSLASLSPADVAQYGALLATQPGRVQSELILADFLRKAVPGTTSDGDVLATALKSFATLSLQCSASDVLSALWSCLNDQLSTADSVSSSHGAVVSILERILRAAHCKHHAEVTVQPLLDEQTTYPDLLAACTGWLLELHITTYNSGQSPRSDAIPFISTILGTKHTHHLLDAFLQISVPPTAAGSYEFLLPLLLWACEQCCSVASPSDHVKFLACCRLGINLSGMSSVALHSSLAAKFRQIGLSVRPPVDLSNWMRERCTSALLQALAFNKRWSASQLSMHLLLYADDDPIDGLLDVVAGQDTATSTTEQADGGAADGGDATADSFDRPSANLFQIDVAGSSVAHEEFVSGDEVGSGSDLDDISVTDDEEEDILEEEGEVEEPMDVQSPGSAAASNTASLAEPAAAAPKENKRLKQDAPKSLNATPAADTTPVAARRQRHNKSPVKSTPHASPSLACSTAVESTDTPRHTTATATTTTTTTPTAPCSTGISTPGQARSPAAKSPSRAAPSAKKTPAASGGKAVALVTPESTPRRRSSRLSHPTTPSPSSSSPVLPVQDSPSKRKHVEEPTQVPESPLASSGKSARKRKSPLKTKAS